MHKATYHAFNAVSELERIEMDLVDVADARRIGGCDSRIKGRTWGRLALKASHRTGLVTLLQLLPQNPVGWPPLYA